MWSRLPRGAGHHAKNRGDEFFLEGCQSGRSGRSRKPLCRKAPWVRIPPPPPILTRDASGSLGMHYVYVLCSAVADRLYIGRSTAPDVRLASHNAGRVRSTKPFRPWRRVLLETHPDRLTAESRERYLKSGWGRRWLAQHLPPSPRDGLAT